MLFLSPENKAAWPSSVAWNDDTSTGWKSRRLLNGRTDVPIYDDSIVYKLSASDIPRDPTGKNLLA
jgi:hypothetical protein